MDFHKDITMLILILAGKPKRNNALKSLAVLLGPDFITDIIEVCYHFTHLH